MTNEDVFGLTKRERDSLKKQNFGFRGSEVQKKILERQVKQKRLQEFLIASNGSRRR